MSIRHYIDKFILLTWKLHKAQWNRPAELLWLIFAPLFLCCIAVGMRMGITLNERYNSYYAPVDLAQSWADLIGTLQERQKLGKQLNKSSNVFMPQLVLAWAPSDISLFGKIMELSLQELKSMELRNFSECSHMRKAISNEFLFAGVCFERGQIESNHEVTDNHLDEAVLPHFNYTIVFPSELRMFSASFIGDNWKTIYQDDPKTSIVRRLNEGSIDGHLGYVREGFINIQKAISETYLTMVSKPKAGIPKIVLRRFPVDGRIQDPLMHYINRGLPLLIIVGFLFPAQILVWQIVQEKQRQMRLYLINMNIGNIIHFAAWFFKGLAYMLISSLLITVIIKVPWKGNQSLLTQTPWYIILLVLCSYNVAATSFCLLVASFFKNTAFALRVATLLWLLTYMPFFVLWNNREKAVLVIRYIACALPNTVLALICESLLEREVFRDTKWMDMGYSLNYNADRISVHQGACIFLITTLVYCAIGLYMDVWNTGETGGGRRKHMPAPAHSGDFTFQERDDSFMPQGSQPVGVKATKIYEVEPSHRRFKIKIKKLCKRYSNNTRGALNSFTWNVYENEVTVLMGHNGCGKTTLLKVLAGLVEPTRGVVMVSDYNIQTERHDASMQLGLALSDDLLLPDLSVADQIRFICMVKGASWKDASEEIETYTQLLHLTHVKHTKVKSLSSQERNLLSIICAFAGGSPVVLIDDIHADLDLVTQALVCNLINEEKSKRTILLVSNSTSLASHLADRLAIMSNGELKCTGSKPFLRNMYGHGFRLTCIKGNAFDLAELRNLLAKYLPNLTVESDIGYKITFVLETKYEDRFPSLFDALEEEMVNLDIISFRLRDTSLDEIFMRFGSEEGDVSGETNLLIEDLNLVLEEADSNGRAKGRRLTQMHIQALFYMRWVLNKRQIPVKVIYLLALLVATACTFSAVLLYGKNYQLIPISFNLTQLHSIDAFVETMSDSLDVLEMQEFFSELLFWYDGHVKVLETADISDFYLLQQSEFNKVVNFRYMFGASFGQDLITVWFNNIPLHAAPYGLNLVHNVIARRFVNEESSIDVTLQPLPFKARVNTLPQTPLSLGGMMAINFSFIFSNIWQGIAIASILEKSFKKQQFLTGVRLSIYSFCLSLFDAIRVVLMSIFMIMMIAVYLSPRHDFHLYIWVFFALIMNGFSVITLSYVLTSICKDPNNAFVAVSFINTIGIIIFTLTVGDRLADMSDAFQLLPQYTFSEIVFKLLFLYEYHWLCKDENIKFVSSKVEKCRITPNCCISYDYWRGNYGVIFDVFMLLCAIMVPLALFLVGEQYTLMACTCLHRAIPKKCIWSEKQDHQARHEGMGAYMVDESVIAERLRVEKLTEQERAELAAVCQGIGKSYGNKSILIRIDLCISKSECVGLMGYNNTGKTTLVKMMVGETRPSHGRIWVGGYSMELERAKCYPLMGYCAQLSILPKDITPREILHIQSKLHGLPTQFAIQVCDALSHLLGFQSCYHQLICLCTTGQVRRITFALAILGDPLLICVDGPPGGIDPNGKRTLYSLTAYMQNRGCSFLYTNLSGLDCERMCQRTPVLYDGQLWTMGAQEQRYRRGYLLEVHFKRKANADISTARSTWDRINQFPVSPHNKLILFVQVKFPEATLQHQQESSMTFFIPRNSTNFSEIFLIIRKDAFELNIEDFYITRNIVTGMQTDLFDRSALKIAT
ncbi:phospholipid-transporting ATPase ABCA3 isoform X1 [Drosophila virilis]|uniref:phospholipid-transporting ATPase ABCA3 isoform X1 n=1 Tax=Drosophila virilis TaxID=7244 RepID=UPI001396554F|nr:ATP-binding cassette sub-family A member 3 isoform X1 [Drosophila virilis]